jgi:hypothetical protein
VVCRFNHQQPARPSRLSPAIRRGPGLRAELLSTCLDVAAHNAAANAPETATPEVRTEHLLAALALDPGSRARRVLNDLGVDIAAIN